MHDHPQKVNQSFGVADDGTPYRAASREDLERLHASYGGGIVEVGR